MIWGCKLFELDLTNFDSIELSIWIKSCREIISQQNFDSYEQYIEAVELFCMEWKEHYRQNEKIYKSEKYKKALLLSGIMNRVKLKIDCGDDTDTYSIDTYENYLNNSIFKSHVEKEIRVILNEYYDKIVNIFRDEHNYKINLNKIVTNQCFNDIETSFRASKYGIKFETANYKELLEFMKKDVNIEIVRDKRTLKKSYNEALESYDVSKTLYNDFISESKCQKSFDKKFFVNLAFALALPYSFAEKLLNYNGLTFSGVGREFESICENAFKIGFDRKIVIALIEKRNKEQKKIFKGNYFPIPNLTKNRNKQII